MSVREIPPHQKYALTLDEAAAYFGIGIKRIKALADNNNGTNDYTLMVGVKRLIKRRRFEEFLDKATAV